ncbi:jg9667 [Pararge aegeria aegeria]|uniref:Jg9667 protein n=1 Tax=Pararge aegeria aegeria TaxID=348720 RepID=A0A8S4RSS4_9NEOP|nr:jg9667 [Pararge aegeria aegeria]
MQPHLRTSSGRNKKFDIFMCLPQLFNWHSAVTSRAIINSCADQSVATGCADDVSTAPPARCLYPFACTRRVTRRLFAYAM